MTVSELITALQRFSGELEVLIPDDDGGDFNTPAQLLYEFDPQRGDAWLFITTTREKDGL